MTFLADSESSHESLSPIFRCPTVLSSIPHIYYALLADVREHSDLTTPISKKVRVFFLYSQTRTGSRI
ncbi:hypothetical protein B0H19DRAFT_1127535 [Mycena capillaripes]|nr:hypothetical protein B0H19DRAFT_1127535 [Mycena capillaripes]